VVYGDAHSYLVAGIWVNQPVIDAQLSDIAPEARPDAVRALVQKRIDHVNSQLATYETIKRFRIMERPLTVEGGLLTSTLKVRRKAVCKAFQEEFEGLYK